MAHTSQPCKKISVVIASYNEELNIRPMYERLTLVLKILSCDYEIVFVNNASTDGSDAVFRGLVQQDDHVKVLVLARNFQSQGAFTAGMEYASGDAVVLMDGDLQDPPELISQMYDKWQEGYHIVYGVRTRRKGSRLRRAGYWLFYRLIRAISYIQIPLDAGDFSILDRRVVDVLNKMPERNRYIRGLRAWVGFRHTGVNYTRDDRAEGETTNSFFDNFRWAALGVFSFSFVPLSLISYVSSFVVCLSILAIVLYVVLHFIGAAPPRGFSTLIVVQLFLGSIQLLSLSVIGQYLGRVFEEVKCRPRYLIMDVLEKQRE